MELEVLRKTGILQQINLKDYSPVVLYLPMYLVTSVDVSYRLKDTNISFKFLNLPFIEYTVSAYSILSFQKHALFFQTFHIVLLVRF